MTELKTLKDICIPSSWFRREDGTLEEIGYTVSPKELRSEAAKWVKYFDGLQMEVKPLNSDAWLAYLHTKNFITKFFNITGSDLK